MRIKTYIADNVQEALYKVKSDLGKDAVILQTKHVKKGGFLGFFSKNVVEVVAANDINLPPKPLKKSGSKPGFQSIKIPNISHGKLAAEPKSYQELRSDLDEVKDMIKKLYNQQSQQPITKDSDLHPLLQKYHDQLISMEIDEEVVNSIMANTQEILSGTELDDVKKVQLTIKKELLSYIDKIQPIELTSESNVIAFVGPTGVGKTTTIAKIAAHFSLYKNKKVSMITADTFRVGAIEQLKMYGDLLEIPVLVVYSLEDIQRILKDLRGYDLLLIDTMGFSPNNKLQIKKVKGLLDAFNPDDVHMVLSAATKCQDMKNILSNYRELGYKKILITKLDETKSYGLILNALIHSKCNLSYITNGQNVPDDIEVASAEKIAEMILGEV